MLERFKKKNGLCAKYRAELEELPGTVGGAKDVAALRRSVPAELARHGEKCESCQEAAETFWMSRQLLQQGRGLESRGGGHEVSPWFVKRVMGRIAEQESKVRAEKTEWSGAVARLASRMAGIAALLLLLLTSTWLYNPGAGTQQKQNGRKAEAPQYLFDSATALSNADDALAGSRGEVE